MLQSRCVTDWRRPDRAFFDRPGSRSDLEFAEDFRRCRAFRNDVEHGERADARDHARHRRDDRRIPTPGDWLIVAAHAEQLGLQPARSSRPAATSRSCGSSGRGRSRQGIQEGTPLVHDGVMFFPNPNDITQAIDGVTGELIWEYRRKLPGGPGDYIPFPAINRSLAIYGNFIFDNGNDQYAYAIDARTGKLAWETKILDYKHGAQHTVRPDHRQRQGDLRPRLRARRRSRSLRDHGVRRADRQGAVAHAHDSEAGRAGRRDVGQHPVRGAPARRHVDGAELRSGAEPHLHRHVGDSPAPKFMLGRQRQAVPVSQLARSRSTPTPARSSGTTSTSSTTGTSTIRSSGCSSTRPWRRIPKRSSGSIRASHRRDLQGDHRHPGQDRHRLHDRSRDRRVPVGAADRRAERDRVGQHRVGATATVSEPDTMFTAPTRTCFVCPSAHRRQELPCRRLQPA